MSGGGKGGSSKTQVKIPAWLEAGARKNMARADEIAQIGYTPYYGPDVASFTPMQQAAMQNASNAASAFGMQAPTNAMAGMPQSQTFAGGVQGYSSQPMFQQSMDAFAAARPGQYAAMNAPFINPVTGAKPSAPFGDSNSGGGQGGGQAAGDPFMAMFNSIAGGHGSNGPSTQSGASMSSAPPMSPYREAYNNQMSFLNGGNDRPSGMGGGK